MERTLYFELKTEYGPLYLYENYKSETDIPVTREFFTQEKGIRRYGYLSFMGNSDFKTVERNMEGLITEEYIKELSPYQFLNKVGGYLISEDSINKKRKDVYNIFDMKANSKGNTTILNDEPQISGELKDVFANKILSKYTSSNSNKRKEI